MRRLLVNHGRPLMFVDAAYRISRALAVAALHREAAGELDVAGIHEQVDALSAWTDRIAEMATKARTIQNSGKLIEQCAVDLKSELDLRVTRVLAMLRGQAN